MHRLNKAVGAVSLEIRREANLQRLSGCPMPRFSAYLRGKLDGILFARLLCAISHEKISMYNEFSIENLNIQNEARFLTGEYLKRNTHSVHSRAE